MAHLQVTAGAGWVLLGAIGAADALNLLAQGLECGVNLQVAVAHHVGIVGTETEGIGSLLLRLGNEAEVKSATRGTRGSRRSGRSRGTLKNNKRDSRRLIVALVTTSCVLTVGRTAEIGDVDLQQVQFHHCDHEVQGVQWAQAVRSCHPYQQSQQNHRVPRCGKERD